MAQPEFQKVLGKAEMSAGGKAAPKKESAPKKEAAPKEEKKEGKKGDKKDAPAAKAKAEAKKAEDPQEARKKLVKKVVKEGAKRGVEIEGAADMGGLGFFCTSVDEPNGDLELLDMCMAAMNEKSDPTEEERKGGSGNIGKMIFSAGDHQLAIIAYVPESKQSECVCE